MGFNKNTWTKDCTSQPGLKKLAAAEAIRKGYKPKHRVDGKNKTKLTQAESAK